MRTRILLLLLSTICISAISQENKGEVPREYYQLKVYTFETDDQVNATDNYLQYAYLPALHRAGLKNIGVFKPKPTDSITPKKIYVLIPFETLAQFENLDPLLAKDTNYLASGDAYINAAHDKAPYQRISSSLLKAFTEMPKMQASKLEGPRKDRIYELRSYEAATEALYRKKVDMFNAGGEVKLFDALGFNAVFYAEVLSGGQMPNLIYMTTHTDQEARDANWKAFSASAVWAKLKVMPKYQNTVSRNETLFLYPTEYSDY